MLRRSEEVEEEEVGVLCNGKRFQLSGVKRTATNKEGECGSTEGSNYDSVFLEEAKFLKVETKTTQYHSEDDSSQARNYVRPTTPGTTRKTQVRTENPLQASFQTNDNSSKNSGRPNQYREVILLL